jgi:hypothetical protein
MTQGKHFRLSKEQVDTLLDEGVLGIQDPNDPNGEYITFELED